MGVKDLAKASISEGNDGATWVHQSLAQVSIKVFILGNENLFNS